MRTLLVMLIAAGPLSAQGPLDRLAWLGGCWQSVDGDRTTVEMWMLPQGGQMIGASRTITGGQARAHEYLRLWVDGDHIVYTAIPSGQTEADFRSIAVSDNGFTVENFEHDFPQRIVYRRVLPDRLVAHVEGPGPNGVQGFDVTFERISCTVSGR